MYSGDDGAMTQASGGDSAGGDDSGHTADRNKRGETHTVMHNSFLLRGLPSSCHLINASFPPSFLPPSLLFTSSPSLPQLPLRLLLPLLRLFSTFLPSSQVILPPISTLHYTSEFPTSFSFSASPQRSVRPPPRLTRLCLPTQA